MTNEKKSWKIEGDTLCSELVVKLNKVSQRIQTALETLPQPLAPPWQMFPDYARTSMGWRMGSGEDYIVYFREWFLTLSEDEKSAYINSTIIPDEWAGWLEAIQS